MRVGRRPISQCAKLAHAPAQQLVAFGRNLSPSQKHEDFNQAMPVVRNRKLARMNAEFECTRPTRRRLAVLPPPCPRWPLWQESIPKRKALPPSACILASSAASVALAENQLLYIRPLSGRNAGNIDHLSRKRLYITTHHGRSAPMPGEGHNVPRLARRGGLTNLPSGARLPKLLRPVAPERAKNQGLIFRTNHNPCLPHESAASLVVSSLRRGEPSPRVLEHSDPESEGVNSMHFGAPPVGKRCTSRSFPARGAPKCPNFGTGNRVSQTSSNIPKVRVVSPPTTRCLRLKLAAFAKTRGFSTSTTYRLGRRNADLR